MHKAHKITLKSDAYFLEVGDITGISVYCDAQSIQYGIGPIPMRFSKTGILLKFSIFIQYLKFAA